MEGREKLQARAGKGGEGLDTNCRSKYCLPHSSLKSLTGLVISLCHLGSALVAEVADWVGDQFVPPQSKFAQGLEEGVRLRILKRKRQVETGV